MNLKKLFAGALAAAICMTVLAVPVFSEDGEDESWTPPATPGPQSVSEPEPPKTFAQTMPLYWSPMDIRVADACNVYNAQHNTKLTYSEYWDLIGREQFDSAAPTAAPAVNSANPNNYTHEQQLAANASLETAAKALQSQIDAQNAAYLAALKK